VPQRVSCATTIHGDAARSRYTPCAPDPRRQRSEAAVLVVRLWCACGSAYAVSQLWDTCRGMATQTGLGTRLEGFSIGDLTVCVSFCVSPLAA